MSWNEAYERERKTELAAVESHFRNLPYAVRETGRLFRAHMLATAGAGDLTGVFSGPDDHPVLYMHHWVLEGRAGDRPGHLTSATTDLTCAAFYTAAALRLSGVIDDPDSLATGDARALLDHLREQAIHQFIPHLPAGSPFWAHHAAAWSRFDHAGERLAPLKLSPLAAAILAGRTDDLERLDGLLERLNTVFGLIQEARDLRRDLQAGRRSGLIEATLEASRIAADDPDWAERLIGAMVLSGALEDPVRFARGELAAARAASTELGLDGFRAYLDRLESSLDRVRTLFKPGGRGEAAPQAAIGFLRPAVDTPGLALETATAFLKSDPIFRESWEIHRYGLFGRAEVTSRFPAGLTLEILCETGRAPHGRVDEFIAYQAEHRFSYFDHPEIVLRDADTLGLALRLWGHGSQPDGRFREELETVLAVMERSVLPDGRIPVWLEGAPDGVRLVGEGCGVVEAHLLLGLLAFDAGRFEAIAARSAGGLFARFAHQGVGISVNYPGLYTLAAVRRLAVALDDVGIQVEWKPAYRAALAAELDRVAFTPQDAAFAISACPDPDLGDLYREDWPVLIRKHQRPDGSWNAEPFCFVANRGNQATWYSSRTLTTAFCYRGMVMAAKNRG